MKLDPAAPSHLADMLGWFPEARSCALWAGPQFRFPFTLDSFIKDSLLAKLQAAA